VLAAVFVVARAGHVLGVLDVLRGTGGVDGAGEGEEHVAGACFADRRGCEAVADVVVVDGLEVVAFEADVEEADGGLLGVVGVRRVELEELAVVELDEALVDLAVFVGEGEGLFEAELVVEVAGGVEGADADGDVGYAGEGRGLLGVGEGCGEDEDGEDKEAAHRVVLEGAFIFLEIVADE
jgi:hypothetical protein